MLLIIGGVLWWALAIIFIDMCVIHALFVHRRLRDQASSCPASRQLR